MTWHNHLRWCEEAEVTFNLSPLHFPNDLTKIRFARKSLRGNPQSGWPEKQKALEEAEEPVTWDVFTHWLLVANTTQEARQADAAQLYEDAKQTPGQSPVQFHHHLRRIEELLEPLPVKHQAQFYMNKLLPGRRQRMHRVRRASYCQTNM